MLFVSLVSLNGGLSNALRGQGIINRAVFALIYAFLLMCNTGVYDFLYWGFLVLSVLLLWSVGWGKYFMAIHGEPRRSEKELWIVDYIIDKLNIRSNYAYGIIGMGLRWLILSIPLSGVLVFYGLPILNLVLFNIVLASVGVFYYIGGRLAMNKAVLIGEFLTGFLLLFSLGVG